MVHALAASDKPAQLTLPLDPVEPRQRPGWGWWTLNTRSDGGSLTQRPYRLDQMEFVLRHCRRDIDTYKSQGFFNAPNRRAVNLAYATHAYVDLDVYKVSILAGGIGVTIDGVVSMVLAECDEWQIPRPSIVVFSGRGLYLKWFWRHPIPRAAAGRAVAVNRALVAAFKDFGADPLAVDMSRILRVVGTSNSRSGEVARIVWQNDAVGGVQMYDFDAFANAVLPYTPEEIRGFREEAQQRRAEIRLLSQERAKRLAERRKAVEAAATGRRPFSREDWHWGVLEDLRTLAERRFPGGVVQQADQGRSAGLDLFGFLGCCQLAMVIPAHQLWHETLAWGRILLPGWYVAGDFHRHCSALLARARESADGKTVPHPRTGRPVSPVYTYSKDRLIDLLEVTQDEMGAMTRLIDVDEKRRRDAEAWIASQRASGVRPRAEYEAQAHAHDEQVQALAKLGHSVREIAQMIGVSKSKVARILKR